MNGEVCCSSNMREETSLQVEDETSGKAQESESILLSIKKLLGIGEDYHHFDTDLVIHINSVFAVLNQIGVGPSDGFVITGEDETWSDFIEGYQLKYSMIKSYVYLKTKLLFDPPLSSSVVGVINEQIKEFEWRLLVTASPA